MKMDPRNAMSRRNLAHFQGMVGIAAAHTGRMKEGLSHLQTALKMWRDLEASGVLEPLDASRPSELESLLHRLSGEIAMPGNAAWLSRTLDWAGGRLLVVCKRFFRSAPG